MTSLLARTPPDPVLLRLCGMALVRTGAVAQGLPYLARARRMDPRDPLGALWHGIALHAGEQYPEAVAALEAAAALSPADPAPLIHRARSLLQCADPAAALATAEQALVLAPSLLEAQHARHLAMIGVLAASATPEPGRLSEAWLDLGLVCLRLGKVADARGAMLQALDIQPLHAVAATHLATVEHLCGEPITAIARLRAVLADNPDCDIARLHLAARLIQDGDAAEALALLGGTHATALDAHWSAQKIDALIRLGRRDEAHAELASVALPIGDAEILLCWQHSLLARQAGDRSQAESLAGHVATLAASRNAARLEHRIDAHFALADLRHAEARREQAFGHWWHGHALLRSAQPFARADHAAFIDAIIRSFDRNRLATGARSANTDPAPVFIVGLPRTGTTLTEHILAAHPAMHGAGERLAIRETLQSLTGTGVAGEAVIRAASFDAQTLTDAASDYLATLHALAPEAAIILDKMPDNFFHLGLIATLLPGARVICCTRDLRDVGASIFQNGFRGYHPYAHDLADLGWYMAQYERLLRHWRAALPRPMLEVDHADWVTNFDATLRRVLGFLDLPYDPACARFHEQDRTVRTASREQVSQPINARGVGRWRTYATQLEPMLRELPSATNAG